MNKFDTKSEALNFLELQKEFIKNVLNIECSWGSRKDGILQALRARDFNYSVKSETPNLIEYSYSDNFNNNIKGCLAL